MNEIAKMRKEVFKVNSYVELVSMDDTQAPPIGTKGFVRNVDDIGTVHIAWQNGSSLGATLEDSIKKVKCNICGNDIIGYPAISRIGNHGEICSECGTRESLKAIGATEDEVNEIINKIKDAHRSIDKQEKVV